ncbi:MAG: prealbumin-like fold domain-containing protein [Marmoricola sp.]
MAALIADPIVSALTVACLPGSGTVVGGFEIDGDTCAETVQDWDTTGLHEDDGFGDSTGFTNGASENDAPTAWGIGGSPNGKTDIGEFWAYSKAINNTVYGYFALTNASTTGGTSQYDLEYNQLAAVPGSGGHPVPHRSPGDLLFRFSSTGSDPLEFTDAKRYTLSSSPAWDPAKCFTTGTTAGWCTIPIPAGAFAQQVNADGTFFEGAIDIGLFVDKVGDCTGNFGVTSVRSVTGNAFATSALKDYVDPLPVNTPSTCGTIVINKNDQDGDPLGGATFTVTPNPVPGNVANPFTVTDNDANDKDADSGVIKISPVTPGVKYTVTETVAPTGYFIADPASQTADTNMAPSGTATFTFVDNKQWQALTATKTANPTYTAQYAWAISKEISADGNAPWVADTSILTPLVKNVPTNGDPTNSTMSYRVKVTEGARTTSSYKVSGTISVTNPNADPVSASISDTLPGATCLVAGSATDNVSVTTGKHDYAYVCTFAGTPTANQLSGDNTASVTWLKTKYPQTAGDVGASGSYEINPTAAYAFGAETTSVDKTVTITDDHHAFPGGFQVTWTAPGNVTTSDPYTIPFQAPAGSCSAVITNTATLTGANSGELGSDQASGQVCAASNLSITRIDARGFKRTYPWGIEKATSTPKINVENGKATASYSVTVTAGSGADSEWAMSGTITGHNPNGFEAISVTSVPVTYTGGGTCAVTGETFPVSIAAGGSHDFAYSCTFGSQPDYAGSINATLNWDQAAAGTPAGSTDSDLAVTEADWEKTLVNASVTVHDDHANGEDNVVGTLNWADVYAMPNHQQTIEYTVDLADLPALGDCNDHVNTAWIVGDENTQLDSDQNADNNSATVEVCNPIGLNVTDTAVGDFTRTFHWKIDKFIDGDQKSQTVTADGDTATFDYTVAATPLDAVDTDWTITGTVGVTNKNSDPDIDPITVTGVEEVLDLGTVSNCVYDKAVPFDLASGESADVGFTCTLDPTPDNDGAVPPTYQGTHQATVTGGPDGTTSSNAADVVWNDPTEIDKTLAVYDNKVTEAAAPVHLGDAVWNAAGTPITFTYELTLPVPANTEGTCAPPFENLAWLGGDGVTPTDLQSGATAVICVPAVIPPEPPQESPLPDTGGPDGQLLLWGLGMLLSGAAIVLMSARRRRS